MSNKYLEKIAELKQPQPDSNKKKVGLGTAIGAALGGGMASGLTLGMAQLGLSKKVMGQVHSEEHESNLSTVKKMIRDNKLNVSFNQRESYIDKHIKNNNHKLVANAMNMAGAPAYMPPEKTGGKGFVLGAKGRTLYGTTKSINPDIIMHELGHAKDFGKHKNIKMGGQVAGKYGNVAGTAMLLNEKTRDYAVPVTAISSLATLRSEGAANYHAYKGIQAHKGTMAANKFAKRLLPSQMGAYGLGAATNVAATYIGKKIIDHRTKALNKVNPPKIKDHS